MKEILAESRRTFGRIDGVIHAAGIPGGGLMQLKNREGVEHVLAATVQGTLVLDRIFQENLRTS